MQWDARGGRTVYQSDMAPGSCWQGRGQAEGQALMGRRSQNKQAEDVHRDQAGPLPADGPLRERSEELVAEDRRLRGHRRLIRRAVTPRVHVVECMAAMCLW